METPTLWGNGIPVLVHCKRIVAPLLFYTEAGCVVEGVTKTDVVIVDVSEVVPDKLLLRGKAVGKTEQGYLVDFPTQQGCRFLLAPEQLVWDE